MSYLKKLIILFCCALMGHQTIAMQKKQFGKVFKNYINKNTKKRFNGLKQIWPLNKAPKLSFSTMRFNSGHWKKCGAIGALLASYGIWNWKNKDWNSLNDEERNILAQPYIKDSNTDLTDNYRFKNASAFEQNCIVNAIIICLQQKQKVDPSWIYHYSNPEQKATLFPALVSALNEGQKFDDLLFIYEYFSAEQKTILLATAINCLKQERPISHLEAAYCHSDEKQRNALFPHIIRWIEKGKLLDEIYTIYKHSSQPQKNTLLPLIITCLKQGIVIPWLDSIYYHSDQAQKKQFI